MKKMLFFVTFSLLLAGCSGGNSTYTASETAAVNYAGDIPAAAVYEAYDNYEYEYDMGYGDYGYEYDTGYGDYEYTYAMTEELNEASAMLTASSSISPAAISQRKLIRNVHMQIETDAFDDLLKQLQSKVTELAGYLESSDISGFHMNDNNTRQNRYAYLTARIPSNKLDQFIEVIENSSNVTSKSEATQDVTLQYSDLESQKKTLSIEQDRIWTLLEKADTIESIIALEEHLSEIRYNLEFIESQLRLFDNQVDYSTIDISVQEVIPTAFTPTAPETVSQRIQKGFSKNVKNLSDTMTSLFILFITGIPIWLPLAVIVFFIVFLIKRQTKGKGKKQEKAENV